MRLEISYESILAAATQISTCATNVLGVRNRTFFLELEMSELGVF